MHVKWAEVGLADSFQKAVSGGETLLNRDVRVDSAKTTSRPSYSIFLAMIWKEITADNYRCHKDWQSN